MPHILSRIGSKRIKIHLCLFTRAGGDVYLDELQGESPGHRLWRAKQSKLGVRRRRKRPTGKQERDFYKRNTDFGCFADAQENYAHRPAAGLYPLE